MLRTIEDYARRALEHRAGLAMVHGKPPENAIVAEGCCFQFLGTSHARRYAAEWLGRLVGYWLPFGLASLWARHASRFPARDDFVIIFLPTEKESTLD
jgi:hypothetical protein